MIFRLPENERAVIYTMGRISGVKGPGIVFVMPGADDSASMSPGTVDRRPRDLPRDDAAKALEQVADFRDAVAKLAAVTVQNVIASRAKDARLRAQGRRRA